MELIVQQLYTQAFNNMSANGEEPIPMWTYPWVHRNRFVRIPQYWDGYMGFSAATSMVRKDGTIVVANRMGGRKVFTDVDSAAEYLVEV